MKHGNHAPRREYSWASGRIKRGGAFTSHILTHKSRKQKRNLRAGGMVADVDQKNISKLIPYK